MKTYLSTGKSANELHSFAGLCCYVEEPSLRLIPRLQKLSGAPSFSDFIRQFSVFTLRRPFIASPLPRG